MTLLETKLFSPVQKHAQHKPSMLHVNISTVRYFEQQKISASAESKPGNRVNPINSWLSCSFIFCPRNLLSQYRGLPSAGKRIRNAFSFPWLFLRRIRNLNGLFMLSVAIFWNTIQPGVSWASQPVSLTGESENLRVGCHPPCSCPCQPREADSGQSAEGIN